MTKDKTALLKRSKQVSATEPEATENEGAVPPKTDAIPEISEKKVPRKLGKSGGRGG